jgi:hypothetical protein
VLSGDAFTDVGGADVGHSVPPQPANVALVTTTSAAQHIPLSRRPITR